MKDSVAQNDTHNLQLSRLELAEVKLDDQDLKDYLVAPDNLGAYQEGMIIPEGYKRCGGCKDVIKFYLFNVNNASKNKCTGNCKKCQRDAAEKSYKKTKKNRNYKEYYQNNKERKQEHARNYYNNNKQEVLAKQKTYHNSSKGKKVMKNAHKKRRLLIANNKGVNYNRELVIDRDKLGGDLPICYICGDPIKFAREIHLDHVVPIALGGSDCFTNIACTHQLCNLRREKDARKLEVSQVESIIERAETYMDNHPELFT